MSTVDDYLLNVNPVHKERLEAIRQLVKQLVPEAEESIAYGMPAYKYRAKPLIYFASFKDHMSIFPTPGPAVELEEKLRNYKVSKGTIQFTLQHPLPDELLKEIILTRRAEIDAAYEI